MTEWIDAATIWQNGTESLARARRKSAQGEMGAVRRKSIVKYGERQE